MSATVLTPDLPLYQQGALTLPRVHHRFRHEVRAPRWPLYQAGLGAAAVQAEPQAQGTVSIAEGSLVASGKGFASGGPIGAVVAGVMSLIVGFWGAHNARVKGAKDENKVVASALQAFDQSLQAIFQAANAGQLAASDAASLCEQQLQTFWQSCAPYTAGAGEHDNSNLGTNCAATKGKCDKDCTATCCVGCMDLAPSVANCVAVFQAGGGTAQILKVFASKYGLSMRASYTLTYTPPAGGTVGASIASALGGGGGLLPIALIAIAAVAFL